MQFTRTDINETFSNGVRVSAETTEVDITADVVTLDLHTKARAALTANATFLALASPTNPQVLAQVQRLTRETSAIIRLLIAGDLLNDTSGT